MAEAATNSTINSVDHAIRLIEELHREQPLSVSELARRLHLPRPTIYRLLRTLGERDLLVQEGTTYRLSLRLLELASAILSASMLQAAAEPALSELVGHLGETAHFAVLDGEKVGYIAKVESPHIIRMFSHVGWRGPLHATGAGKVLLAWSGSALVQKVLEKKLERFTPRTITDARVLESNLKDIRERGYGMDQEELVEGLTCVAVPVFVDERLIGVVSVSGPSERLASIDKIVGEAKRTAADVSKRL
jgi:DNA-binding IclR family transcriptional regulator